jgi:hypothetical protein
MHFDLIKPKNTPISNPTELSWSELNAEWENSKESQASFCKRKNINLNTFTYWRSKCTLKENKETKQLENFIPVKIKPENVSIISPIIIENTSGIKILIPAHLSENQLAEILKLVGFHHAKN